MRESLLVLGVSVAVTAGYAVYAGQDINWDQRNYHLYNVYAWLAGRTFTDVAPAQVQTWLNPLAHLPQYLLIQYLPPVLAGMAMGAVAGVNGLVLWVLTRRLQGGDKDWPARVGAAVVTVMGLTSPLFVSEIGTTFAEYLCSPLVLGALIALTPTDAARTPGARHFGIAGFLLGAAVGLKPVNLVYVVGLAVSLIAAWSTLELRVRTLLFHAAGGICGVVATGGYWSAHLWLATGNPLFPFYNAVFASPLFAPVNFADMRFVPPSVATAAITYPFAWFLGMHPTSELPFREARFALVAAFLPVACVVSALRRTRGGFDGPDGLTTDASRRFCLLAVFFVTSYVVWLAKFGIHRYAIPLELLAGLLLLLSLDRVLRTRRELYIVFAVLALFAVLWSRPSDWGRMPYGSDWVGVTNAPSRPPTLYVLVGGGAPTAYVIPSLSPADRFIRLTGNTPLEPDAPLGRRAASMLDTYTGRIRTLSVAPLADDDRAHLARFGLTSVGASACEQFQSRLDRFITCELTRTAPPARSGL